MLRPRYALSLVATIAILIATVNPAFAFRCHRRCQSSCSSQCRSSCYDLNATCIQYPLYPTGATTFMYLAYYYPDTCFDDPWAFPVESTEIQNLPQNCLDGHCIYRGACAAPKFPELSTSSGGGYAPQWDPSITEVRKFYMCIHLCGSGAHKAEVYELELPNRKHMYMAFEIDNYPTGEKPQCFPILCKFKCCSDHTYSIKTLGGRKMIFFTK